LTDLEDGIKGVKVLPHQKTFIESINPTTGLIAGFGAGKSFAGTLKTIVKKLQYPSVNVAYYLPNYPLIKDICWEVFPQMCNDLGLHYQLNKSDKELHIHKFGKILFRNMSEPEMIVGYEVGFSLIDECDVMPRHKMDKAFKQILARNRAPLPDKKPNQVDLVGTPEGYRFAYNLLVANKPDNYRLIKASTYENKHLPEDYIDTLKDTYDEKLLQQYLLGEFVNVNGSAVYHQFDRDVHVCDNIAINPSLPLIISFDFNINPYNAIYLIQVIDGKVTIIDNAILKGKPLVDSLDYLKSKFAHLGASLFSATIYGDAAGKARSQGTAQTNYDLIRDAGFHKMKIKTANPRIQDRNNAFNSMLRNGAGSVNIAICSRNQELITDLEQMSYNDKGEVDKSNQDLTHSVDSVGYYIEYEHGLHKTEVRNIRMRVG